MHVVMAAWTVGVAAGQDAQTPALRPQLPPSTKEAHAAGVMPTVELEKHPNVGVQPVTPGTGTLGPDPSLATFQL